MVNRCYYLESNIEKELQKYFEKLINYPISLINSLLLISMKHTKLVLLEDAEVFWRIHNRCQLTPDFRLNLPLWIEYTATYGQAVHPLISSS